jgi:hypothetical protein
VGAHATPGRCHRGRRGSEKEASTLLMVAFVFVGFSVSFVLLTAVFLD